MTSEELQTARAARFNALRPAEVSAPGLLAWAQATGFLDPSAIDGWSAAGLELAEQELASGRLIELLLWPGSHRYASGALARYLYACVGDRHPLRDYKNQARARRLSWLAAEVFEIMLVRDAAWTSAQVRDRLGAERTSALGVEAALRELGATLKVLRVGREGDGSARWRALVQILPEVPRAASVISLVQAAAALASQWLDVNVCGTEEEMGSYFAPLFSRARIHAALAGLEAGREIELDAVDGRRAYRLRRA